MPKDPGHTVRVPDAIWSGAQERAQLEGKSMGEVVRQLLTRYATRKARP